MGFNESCDLGLKLDKEFRGPLAANYRDWIFGKHYTVLELNDLLGDCHVVSEMINPECLDPTTEKGKKVYKALDDNAIIDWTPKAKLTLHHSPTDIDVPYANSTDAYEAFKAKGCNVTLKNLSDTHQKAGEKFFTNLFMKFIF